MVFGAGAKKREEEVRQTSGRVRRAAGLRVLQTRNADTTSCAAANFPFIPFTPSPPQVQKLLEEKEFWRVQVDKVVLEKNYYLSRCAKVNAPMPNSDSRQPCS